MTTVQQPTIEGEIVHSEPETKKKSRAITRRDDSALVASSPAPGSIEDLMVRAVEQGNMDVIERVFALSRTVQADRAKRAFFDSLATFQSTVPKIRKTKKGYNYWYAPLGAIDAQTKSALQGCGLSKRWEISETGEAVVVTCVITHAEGHSEHSSIGPVPWDFLERTNQMNSLQHRAAVIQYLQRYTLIAALGLSTADDDPDGVIPEDARDQRPARPPVSQPKAKPTTTQKAKAATPVERVHLTPATPGEEVEAATIKVLTSKMELAALSNSDFKKRFGLDGIEQVKRTDLQTILGWIIDPQNA